MDDHSSLSWIGFTDLFLHLFIFFLAGFMLLKYFAATQVEEARAAKDMTKDVVAQYEECGKQKGQMGKACQSLLAEYDKAIDSKFNSLVTCRKQKTRLENELQQCEIELATTRRLVSDSKKREELAAAFGQIISQALSVLEKLKKEMESNLPIQIDRRPDRLFFDMGVSFSFNKTRIPPKQKQAIINIGNTFRKILDRQVPITKSNGRFYRLHEIMRIVIEGHADYKKRRKDDQLTNYTVSKDRAFEVMKLLMGKSALVPPKYKMSIAGFAEYGRQPKFTQEEKTNKALIRRRMRRVTISIVPDYDELLMEGRK
ncbi:hypothetical protein [Candidatus Parabeggiatoa sp. HSG14]|uniref:hypothetical protein n=1 Tax=Candidatus Parabeggiatoa sp. HSG14 TaxID=3055593 RepID=UPI0025A6FDCA|nr:hypothetical protein [Thiotrichales bacterium HSG14]